MASLKAAKSAEITNEETLNGLMKQAQSYLEKHQPSAASQRTTSGAIQNSTNKNLVYYDSHNWSGEVIIDYPKLILDKGLGPFVHSAPSADADEGAVVYSVEGSEYGMLLAWYAPKEGDKTSNKVYVKGGLSAELVSDWNAVKLLLENSKDYCIYEDTEAKVRLSAKVNMRGNPADVGAMYEKY